MNGVKWTEEKVVVALGGNALIRGGQKGTAEEQLENIRASLDGIIGLIKSGYGLVITHGNGPQVGNMLLMVEAARGKVPELSLGLCVADTEGALGYMIQQTLVNRLRHEGIQKGVVTIITQVVVEQDDPAFKAPTKPVGPYMSKEEAGAFKRDRGWQFTYIEGRGHRRVVASPGPVGIVEKEAIKRLLGWGEIVVAAGGGGIPVVEEEGSLKGVDAVIDKDRASAMLALDIGASCLAMLTDVEAVCLNFGKPEERPLRRLTLQEAEEFLAKGHFPPGSMGPKIEAAITFLKGGGRRALITSIEGLKEGMEGRRGTVIE